MSKTKAITVIPEVLTPAIPDDFGKQITEQFHRAIGGTKEIVIFGAMLWKVRDSLISARGNKVLPRGVNSDGGVKAWLAENAPDVKLSTAYRFLGIAESVAQEYAAIVGNRVAKQFTLADLVTTPAAELPEDAREKQLSLFDYVAGTSQRSWLDRFKPIEPRGGDHGGAGKKGKPKSPAQQRFEMQERCKRLGEGLQSVQKKGDYRVLDLADLDGLHDLLSQLLTDVKEWRKKPQTEKQAALEEA